VRPPALAGLRNALPARRRNVQRRVALLIELQNYHITFSALHARMLPEIIYVKRRVHAVLFDVSSASLLDIPATIGLIMGPTAPSLASLAHRLPRSTLLATNCSVLDRLRWRSTVTADLRLQYRRSYWQPSYRRKKVSAQYTPSRDLATTPGVRRARVSAHSID